MHLLHELSPEVLKGPGVEGLQLLFVGERPDHGAAVPLDEVALEGASDLILRVVVGASFREGVFEVGLLSDGRALGVHELEGEVSDHPEEAGQVPADVLSLLPRPQLDVLRYVRNQRQTLERVFVDAPH